MVKAPRIAKPEARTPAELDRGRPGGKAWSPQPDRGPARQAGVAAPAWRRDFADVPIRATALYDYPHRSEIGRCLGRTFSAEAVFDPGQCAKLGVLGFTRAGRAHFLSPNPSLRVAAHEAAHLLQQQGATRDMGLGAERHAAAIEARTADGADARDLIGREGAPIPPDTLHYTAINEEEQSPGKWSAGQPLRVSDDGHMAVGMNDPCHHLWAEEDMIKASNKVLKASDSIIRLKKKKAEKLDGPAPDGSGSRALVRAQPVNQWNHTAGEDMTLWADCDRSAFGVMGVKGGTGGKPPNLRAVYKGPDASGEPNGTAEQQEKLTKQSHPDDTKREILRQYLPKTAGDPFATYVKLTAEDRDIIDAKAGINKYASPGVGEGYTIAAQLSRTDERWIYHWAAVVMASGDDRVTLENFSVSDVDAENAGWGFKMYGSAKKADQTFHEQQTATGHHGEVPITTKVRKR